MEGRRHRRARPVAGKDVRHQRPCERINETATDSQAGEWVGLFIEPHQPIDQRATDGIIRIVSSVGETCGVKNRMH